MVTVKTGAFPAPRARRRTWNLDATVAKLLVELEGERAAG
jgi:hypothetical protein